jgi:hypothetical protein
MLDRTIIALEDPLGTISQLARAVVSLSTALEKDDSIPIATIGEQIDQIAMALQDKEPPEATGD